MRNVPRPLLAAACLLAACAEPPHPAPPITTVRAVEATELFAAFEFTLDSASTTPTVRVYRVPRSNGRRFTTLRLTMASDTMVSTVQLGLPPAYLKRIALLAKEPLADFFRASLGVNDTTAFAVFRGELETTTIIMDSAQQQAPAAASPLPKVSQTYLALFNAVPFAQATHGPYRLRIDNIANVEGDSAVVVTILSSSNVGVAPVPADWIPPRPVPLLGATIREVNESAIVEELQLDAGERRGDTITYLRRDEDGAVSVLLRIEVDARGAVDRLALTMRTVLAVEVAFAVEEIFHAAAKLVPPADSAHVTNVASAPYAPNPGTDRAKYAAVAAVLEGKRAEAMASYSASTVRIYLPPTTVDVPPSGSASFRGSPGDFVTIEVSALNRPRP